jgi:hypothetical protein
MHQDRIVLAGAALANEATIQRFYAAFVESDVDTMIACYSPDAHFSDSMFPNLRGKQIFAMWSFLLAGKPYVMYTCSLRRTSALC